MSEKVLTDALGWIVNHKACIEQYYEFDSKESEAGSPQCKSYKCPDAMFDIQNTFMMDSQFEKEKQKQPHINSGDLTGEVIRTRKKRKRKLPENSGEIAAIEFHTKVASILERALSQLVTLALQTGVLEKKQKSLQDSDNNKNARQFSKTKGPGDNLVTLTNKASEAEVTSSEKVLITEGGRSDSCLFNTMVHCENEKAIPLDVCGSCYIIPPKCAFVMSDMSTLQPLLTDGKKYNIIVLDPPWQNKSIKRKKMYNTVTNDVLLTLPLQELLADQAVVVVWVTNKQKQHRFVVEEIFPKMKLHYRAHWFWLKVTKYGEPVLPLDGEQKKPYECLILGTVGNVIQIPENKVLVSVPSALHSRKPPLEEVLTPIVKGCLKSDIQCLEMFARNLTPGWTSWGNEALRHQHSDFFMSDNV